MLAYRYNKSYQDNYKSWKEQGVSDKQAREYASRAALELAEVSEDGKSVTTATTRGEENLIVNEEGKTADQLTPPPSSSDKDGKAETADEKIARLFDGKDSILKKGLAEMGKAVSTNTSGTKIDNSQQNKTESKLDTLRALSANRDAAMEPSVIESNAAPIMGGNVDEIIIPGDDKLDADDFLMPKFGVLTEFTSTYSNLM